MQHNDGQSIHETGLQDRLVCGYATAHSIPRGGPGPAEAHTLSQGGSTPPPATNSAPAGASQHPSFLLSSLPPAGVVTVSAREGRR